MDEMHSQFKLRKHTMQKKKIILETALLSSALFTACHRGPIKTDVQDPKQQEDITIQETKNFDPEDNVMVPLYGPIFWAR